MPDMLCLCFILIIHLLRYKEVASTVTRLISSESMRPAKNWKGQSRAQEDGGLFRITEYSKYPALHIKLTPSPCHCRRSLFIKGLSWAQISSQSSFRWDEYKAGNIVKDLTKQNKNNPPVVNRMGNVENVTRCWPLTEQQFHRTERNRLKPNEARWKKEQTKDLLKAAEDARDKNRMAKGWERGTYRDTSVFR